MTKKTKSNTFDVYKNIFYFSFFIYAIGLMSRVFANSLREWGSIPG